MLQIVGTWYLQNLDPLKQTAGSHKIDGLGRCFSFSSRGYFQVNQPFVLRGVECEVMAAMLLNCWNTSQLDSWISKNHQQ